jgi:uncharacterized protein (DUF885 family)
VRFFRPLVSSVSLASAVFCLPAPAQKLTAGPPAANAPVGERRDAMNAYFQQYWDALLEHNPEFASEIGDNRFNDKITDYSVKAVNDWLEQEQNFLMKIGSIDTKGFTDSEKLSHDILLTDLADDIEGSEFKEWEMPVTQMGGIYATYPQLVAQLSFKEVKDYDDWIARLRQIPTAFDQVKELASQKPEDSPLALPLKKFPASIAQADQDRIRAEMLDVIGKKVLPAYQRFAHFMEVSYVPAGRAEPGIWALPDGAAYYKFLIRQTTTTDLTADQIHKIGEEEVAKDEAAMLAIAQKLGFKDLKSFQASLKTNPKLHPASAEALLDAYKGYLGPMQAKLPQLFGTLPKLPFEVVPVPGYLEKTSAPAYYQPGTPDGSRPGRLNIDTYDAKDRNLYQVESIAYHEGIPGHHLQISIAQELTGVPTFRKYEGFTAYTEGWGLYAERLGKDVGFYQDPYSDYGRLEADIWRAIRLVVDTGVHSEHWSRQQMVDYFHAHSNIDEPSVQAEVDRYIAWPSQALAYKIGQLKILELRDQAKQALGPKFDIRAFHDEILDAGAMPLDMLDARIQAWIKSEQ